DVFKNMYDKHIEEIGMITLITSIQNQQVKAWKKLKQRKYRKQTGTFIVEGFHLVEEAYNSNWNIETILIQENVVHPERSEERRVGKESRSRRGPYEEKERRTKE